MTNNELSDSAGLLGALATVMLLVITNKDTCNSEKAKSSPTLLNLMGVMVVVYIQVFGLQFHHSLYNSVLLQEGWLQCNSAKVSQSTTALTCLLRCANFPTFIISAKNQINTITCALSLSKPDAPTYKME